MSGGRLREVKNKRKFETFSSKSGHGRLREVVATDGLTVVIRLSRVQFRELLGE